jgi:hypothetical protein
MVIGPVVALDRGEPTPVSDNIPAGPPLDLGKAKFVKDRRGGLFGGKRLKSDSTGLISLALDAAPFSALLQSLSDAARRVPADGGLRASDAGHVERLAAEAHQNLSVLCRYGRLDDGDARLVDDLLKAAFCLGRLSKRMNLRQYEPAAVQGRKSRDGSIKGRQRRRLQAQKDRQDDLTRINGRKVSKTDYVRAVREHLRKSKTAGQPISLNAAINATLRDFEGAERPPPGPRTLRNWCNSANPPVRSV